MPCKKSYLLLLADYNPPTFLFAALYVQNHKLEATLNWHLHNGALQDASVLQLLVMQAAADGNAAIMSLLLPMFEKMGWLVSHKHAQALSPVSVPRTFVLGLFSCTNQPASARHESAV